MKKNKITVIPGEAKLITPNRIAVKAADQKTTEVSTKHTIIATGGRAATLPGVTLDGKKVIAYREAMILPERPKSMTIIGAGAIGLEFAYFYATFGTEVTVIEYLDRLLPTGDDDISAALARAFKKQGIKSHTASKVKSVE